MEAKHPWRARVAVSVIMLAMAFLGLIITDIRAAGGWDYWKWVVPAYAILALWLSWYMRRQMQTIAPYTVYHEILHWAGTLGAVFITSCYVDLGITSRFIAGQFNLILLSLGLFLAGVYIETTFIFVGLVLAAMALSSAFLTQYLFAIMIPITIGAAFFIGLTIWVSHKSFKQ